MLLNPQPLIQLGPGSEKTVENVSVAEVHSLRDGARRKCAEFAIAIDLEGVQLYNIGNAKLLKGYSVPPQTTFTCAPASVNHKRPDGTVRRITYAATRGKGSTTSKIYGWIETLGKNVSLKDGLVTYSWQSPANDSSIVWTGIYQTSEEGSVGLLIVRENGQLTLLSEDLKQEYWSFAVPTQEVSAVFSLPNSQTQSGILKNREDILIKLEALEASGVIVIVSKQSSGKIQVHALALHKGGRTGMHTSRDSIEQLLMLELPDSRLVSTNFRLHQPSGRLIQHSDDTLAFYDLSTPQASLEKTLPCHTKIHSVSPISTSTVAITTSDSVLVLDTTYGSVKASYPLRGKTKLPTKALSYFSPLGSIIVLQDHRLISYQVVASNNKEDVRKGLKHGTLAGAICRGMAMRSGEKEVATDVYVPPRLGKYNVPDTVTKEWQSTRTSLGRFAKKGRLEQFEKTALKHLQAHETTGKSATLWQNREKITVVLDALFNLTKSHSAGEGIAQNGLKLRISPPLTIGWLIENGFFTQDQIELALKHMGRLAPAESLVSCAMIDALYNHDPSLQTLSFLLSTPISITAQEIVRTIFHILQALQQAHNLANKTRLLTNGLTAPDTEMKDATPRPDVVPSSDPDEAESANSAELENPASLKSDADKVDDAHALMRICLTRLASCREHDLPAAFKKQLPTSSLLSFIEYLRLDLAKGGWFLPYDEELSDAANRSLKQPDDHMHTVAVLLGVAVDILGTDVWIAPSTSANDIDRTIAHMKAEVSAALEGTLESEYLQRLLKEFLQFAATDPPPPIDDSTRGKKRSWQGDTLVAPDGMEMAKPVTVWQGGMSNPLPLGLKATETGKLDSLYRVQAGGNVAKRSKRDIGRLMSMQVGAYSLEQIMI